MTAIRLAAVNIIQAVIDGSSLTAALDKNLDKIKNATDKAWVQAATYGVCRFYFQLDALLAQLLKKPLKAKDSDLYALLLLGLYQLLDMRIAEYAAVAETVAVVDKLKKTWAKGLINAILREFIREKATLLAALALAEDEEAYYAHPQWLIEHIKTAWPTDWQAILTANNTHPPLTLRINQRKISRNEYLALVKDAEACEFNDQGIILANPTNIEELPGYKSGLFSVQDAAAQFAAPLLDLKPGMRVLDACAAPGGKLTHIMELEPKLQACVAVESDALRIQRIQQNLRRLQLKGKCLHADAGDLDAWWEGILFDAVLLDAPCSATGVIRRHPDIKLLRQANDLDNLVATQAYLLQQLWQTLKPGGKLLYVTCSVLPVENFQQIAKFLASHQDAKELELAEAWGRACSHGRQILPGEHNMDGFYYALLQKAVDVTG